MIDWLGGRRPLEIVLMLTALLALAVAGCDIATGGGFEGTAHATQR